MSTPIDSDERFRQLRRLTEVGRALSYVESPEEILELTVERTRTILGCERVALLLVDAAGVLSVRAARGLAGCDLPGELIGEAFVGRVRVEIEEAGRTRFIAVPLVMGGHVAGVLAAGLPLAGAEEGDEWLLAALADQAAVALERTHSQAAVRGAEHELKRWKHIFENAGWAVAVVRPGTRRIEVANPAFAAMHGWTPGELAGAPLEVTLAPDARDELERCSEGSRADDAVCESWHVRKDGTRFPVLAHVSAFRDEAGAVQYLAGTYQDIAAIKRAERVLAEAVRSRDAFLTVASHELKTPLTPLRLQVESLLRLVAREGRRAPREKLRKRLEGAERQVAQLERLVANLLLVAELMEGRLVLRPEATDLGALVAQVAARARVGLDPRTALRVSAPERITGAWDRARLEHVLSSLVSNALKYGEGQPVDIEVTADAASASIVVRDRGIGISPEHQRRIFERFERAVPSERYGGLGLGLWVARRLVEAMEGTIAVTSRPGAGAVFRVTLPRRPAASSAAA